MEKNNFYKVLTLDYNYYNYYPFEDLTIRLD